MKKLVLIAVATLAACTAGVTRENLPKRDGPHERPAQPAPEPQPEPAPQPVVSVHPACDGVAAEVLDIPPEWTIRVLHAEANLPLPEDTAAYFDGVDGLADVIPDPDFDPDARDFFYVHAHYYSLGKLYVRYPKLDRGLLREAKLVACQRALAGGVP